MDNISLSSHFGAIAGITQAELEATFVPEINALQKERPDICGQIKDWYNGYTWNMRTWVYNPFSLLKFMRDPIFQNYWYETGTPSFIFKLLNERTLYDVEGIEMGRLDLSTFDVKNADPGPLLFQTGYVPLKNISSNNKIFELGYPNLEVKESFLNGLLSSYREIYPTGSMRVIVK